MDTRVTLDFLERHNQPLHDKVVDMLVQQNLTPSNVGFILVDCSAGYRHDAMTELQHYVQSHAYRHAWLMEDMDKSHPKPEPLSGFAARIKDKLQQVP